MSLNALIDHLNDLVWSWPSIFFVIAVTIFCTIAFRFIQIRTFFRMWKDTLFPEDAGEHSGDISPKQAFLGALSSCLGNGSLAGIAVAIAMGGPGAALWVIVFGMALMSVRFAEVYLSLSKSFCTQKTDSALGGPMVYLREVIGGKYLAYAYGLSCFIFALLGGNAAQANSISLSFATAWGVPTLVSAVLLTAFVTYILFGGAARIAQISAMIVPVKVVVFFVASGAVLIYHASSLLGALKLIISSGLSGEALAGGVIGFSFQQALRSGILGVTFATEAGLGTSAILFGCSGGDKPFQSGLMAMLSTFISLVVCLIIALCIVASGVWQTGATSTALTIAAFDTVFGSFGGWIVSFLAAAFGVGVLVTYAYITRAAWLYLTNNRFEFVFIIMYCAVAFFGSLVKVDIVWNSLNIIMALMLFINLFGIAYLTPRIARELKSIK